MPILAWLISKFSFSAVSALFGQVAAIYAKSKDTKLAGLQAIVGAEATQNEHYMTAVVENNRIREAASHSIVALTIVAVFCIPAAMHSAALSLNMVYHLGWNIDPLTAFEREALESFLFVAPSLPLISAGAQRLASKL